MCLHNTYKIKQMFILTLRINEDIIRRNNEEQVEILFEHHVK